MCRICDGFSWEEVVAEDAATIAKYGFMVQGVGGEDDPESWAYTIGLLDACNHPELIVAGVPWRRGGPLLSSLGQRVFNGKRYVVGDKLRIESGTAWVGAVDEIQYGLDTFNMWHALRDEGVLHALELSAVQVVLPDEPWQKFLDDPDARV